MNGDLAETEWAPVTCPSAEWTNWPSLHAQEKSGVRRAGTPLSATQIERRVRYVNENYEVLDWPIVNSKAQVICKNKDSHTTDTGDGQTVIFIGSDDMGAVSYYCSHTHCRAGFNKEETTRLCEGFLAGDTFILPNDNVGFSQMLKGVYSALADSGAFYRRSEAYPYSMLRWKPGDEEPLPISRETMADALGKENIRFSKYKTGGALVPTIAQRETAASILAAGEARALPICEAVVKTALLVKTKNGAETVSKSYVPELRTIVIGKEDDLPQIGFEEGLKNTNELLDYWLWKEPGDRARGAAELLTPALLHGGFIERPVPAMLMLADDYAAGKTAWQIDVARIYGHSLDPHAYTKNSIGSIEEQLQGGLQRGDPFFFIDELDGTIKNTFINAFITGGDEITVRTAYSRAVTVSSKKIMVMLAGVKGFVLEAQLASRCVPIRIIKPVDSRNFFTPEGIDLKTWIIDNARRYLASIYAIIKEWVRRGAGIDRTHHSRFPIWDGTINGILSGIMNLPQATKGLDNLQEEVSNPNQKWCLDFIEALLEEGIMYRSGDDEGKIIRQTGLRQIVTNAGLEVPGVTPGLRDDALMNNQTRRIGEIIKTLPRVPQTNGREPIYSLGEFYLVQYVERDRRHNKDIKYYLFSNTIDIPRKVVQHVIMTDPSVS